MATRKKNTNLSGKKAAYGRKTTTTRSRAAARKKPATSRSRPASPRATTRKNTTSRSRAATTKTKSAPKKKKVPFAKSRSAAARKTKGKGKILGIPNIKIPIKRKGPGKKGRGKAPGKGVAIPADFDFSNIPIQIKPPPRPIKTGLSADRKMEIIGILLSLTGLLTLFSLLSASRSSVTGAWISFWQRALGGGVYLLPPILILLGVWLIVRNFERVPQLAVERILGLFLLFINILVIFHLWVSPVGQEAAYALAAQGLGGGYIGAAIMVLLENGLGTLGLFIAIFAWFLVAFSMSLDVSIPTLFKWVPPTAQKSKQVWDKYKNKTPSTPPTPAADGYTPISKSVSIAPTNTQTETQPEPQTTPAETSTPKSSKKQKAASKTKEKTPTPQQTELPPTVPALGNVTKTKNWVLPNPKKLLVQSAEVIYNDDHDRTRAKIIEDTLSSFGAPAHVIEINRGPTITQYGVEPDFIETRNGRTRVRVGKIAALADDLSLALAASRIRIQAPVPGKGYVGIEVPNEQIAIVSLRDVVENQAFDHLKSNLRFALGQDVAGSAVAADLIGMPHLLIAGATGSGKSVFVNALIACLLLHNTPETLRIIMIDPKRVELTNYNGIPHLLAPVVTEIDRVVGVLQWVTREMDGRYQKFADMGVRNITSYNKKSKKMSEQTLPYLVLIIDELADMMMIAPDQTERLITRMAQLARATGIHLVISTQRPSVDVVTGLIKANFPARISFAVASGTDSRVVLDQPGAERLLGRGDMLFQAPDAAAPIRLQGVFVSDHELHEIIEYWRAFGGPTTTAPVPTSTPVSPSIPTSNIPLKQIPIWDEMKEEEVKDLVYQEAVDLVRRKNRASISMLQRTLRIGYTRSARIIEQMEQDGIVGPHLGGSKAREILDYGQLAPPAGED